jgi:hypothetical protein
MGEIDRPLPSLSVKIHARPTPAPFCSMGGDQTKQAARFRAACGLVLLS